MKEKILSALKAKFVGVNATILDRIAAMLAKTVTTEEQVSTAVEGVTREYISVIEAYGDSRATDAQQTAVRNYETKYGLKDGEKVNAADDNNGEGSQQQSHTTTTNGGEEAVPAWAKTLIESNNALKQRLDQMDGERTTKSRKAIIEEIIKPLSESSRKPYQHIALGSMSEEDFTALQETIKGEVQEIANEQNARGTVFGRPASTGKQNTSKATKEEADEFLKLMKR